MGNHQAVKLSIVTTLYRSAANIDEFYRRTIAAAEAVADDIELVIVNDGSPDHSIELALELQRTDPRIVIVDLARNFGHHKGDDDGPSPTSASATWFSLIDSDLEEQPEDTTGIVLPAALPRATATWYMACRRPGAAAPSSA